VGFVTRHKERDLKLPERRDMLLKNALDDLTNDPEVLGVYLGGSLAKGNDDLYSDIDLHIIVSSEKKAEFISKKRERPKKWGTVLYFEGPSYTPVVVTHFDCFVKIDTHYKVPNELQPSIWLHGLKALYDPKGIIEKVFNESNKLTYKPTSEDIEVWRGKAFAYIHETYRAVMRNEYFYALSNLDRFRWLIAYGWYMEKEYRIDGSYGVWSKLEGDRSRLEEWQIVLLHSWDTTKHPEQIMKTMASIVPEFMRLNKVLCNLTGLEENEELCKKVLDMVL
jgi:predicted nucleotidyltransferase